MAGSPRNYREKPVIRVFVSSTFSDFKLERDALQQQVFPTLEKHCLEEGFQFQAIDLRWGVSTEAGLDHRTMQICFEELHRSQEISPEPNFLILLGNRYGWRPLPEAISVKQFKELEIAAAEIDEQDDENGSSQRVLRKWYLRDDNSIPPVYLLRSRIRTPCETDVGKWTKAEQILWAIINNAYPPESMDERRFQEPALSTEERFGAPSFPEIVRFQASATEQEIWGGALNIESPEQHVLACFREIRNLKDFRSEKNPRGLNAEGARDFLCVRNGEIDTKLHDWQEQLKAELRKRLKCDPKRPLEQSRCFTLEGAVLRERPNGSTGQDGSSRWEIDRSGGYQESIQSMCHWVTDRFLEIIHRQIDDWRKPRTALYQHNRDLEIEHQEHLRFADERAVHFIGRRKPLGEIESYLEGDSRLPLVVHGPSGCGKTALLARAFQRVPQENHAIIRFIGITPNASHLRALLSNLCLELRQKNLVSEPLPEDIQELQREFRSHLGTASQECPIILFLDALDQLSDADAGLQLHWLPGGPSELLPKHVKIVVSCLSDCEDHDPAGEPFANLQQRELIQEKQELPALSLEDAQTLLFEHWLRSEGRTLDGNHSNNKTQRNLVEHCLSFGEECRQPLYLKLLFGEIKQWRSWHKPSQPGHSVEELIDQLVARLSNEANHGALLVERVLGYLATSRSGLSETEILEVLFADKDYKQELENRGKHTNHTLPSDPPRIPIAIWARLHSDLAPYLTTRELFGRDLVTFYHRQIRNALTRVPFESRNRLFHEQLASYFEEKWRHGDHHALHDLPYHLSKTGNMERLLAGVATYEFAQASCRHLSVDEYRNGLLDAFHAAQENGSICTTLQLLTAWGYATTAYESDSSEMGHQYFRQGRIGDAVNSILAQLPDRRVINQLVELALKVIKKGAPEEQRLVLTAIRNAHLDCPPDLKARYLRMVDRFVSLGNPDALDCLFRANESERVGLVITYMIGTMNWGTALASEIHQRIKSVFDNFDRGILSLILACRCSRSHISTRPIVTTLRECIPAISDDQERLELVEACSRWFPLLASAGLTATDIGIISDDPEQLVDWRPPVSESIENTSKKECEGFTFLNAGHENTTSTQQSVVQPFGRILRRSLCRLISNSEEFEPIRSDLIQKHIHAMIGACGAETSESLLLRSLLEKEVVTQTDLKKAFEEKSIRLDEAAELLEAFLVSGSVQQAKRAIQDSLSEPDQSDVLQRVIEVLDRLPFETERTQLYEECLRYFREDVIHRPPDLIPGLVRGLLLLGKTDNAAAWTAFLKGKLAPSISIRPPKIFDSSTAISCLRLHSELMRIPWPEGEEVFLETCCSRALELAGEEGGFRDLLQQEYGIGDEGGFPWLADRMAALRIASIASQESDCRESLQILLTFLQYGKINDDREHIRCWFFWLSVLSDLSIKPILPEWKMQVMPRKDNTLNAWERQLLSILEPSAVTGPKNLGLLDLLLDVSIHWHELAPTDASLVQTTFGDLISKQFLERLTSDSERLRALSTLGKASVWIGLSTESERCVDIMNELNANAAQNLRQELAWIERLRNGDIAAATERRLTTEFPFAVERLIRHYETRKETVVLISMTTRLLPFIPSLWPQMLLALTKLASKQATTNQLESVVSTFRDFYKEACQRDHE